MHPVVGSEISRRFMQPQPLMPLSRRALYERRPVVVNSISEMPGARNDYDWELDWPALLYAPITAVGERPVGLMILGCRTDHWYSEEEIAYMHTLGVSLAPMVSGLRRLLSGLNESETVVAQLLSHGLSSQEIARAMNTNEPKARSLVEKVTRRGLAW